MSALHITNGDCAASRLRAFLTEPVVITADPLFEGPAPEVPDDQWYQLRGRHLSDGSSERADAIARDLAAWDRSLADAASRGRQIVLWFEHDLFDQLLLIRTLDRIDAASLGATTVSLICVDRFPGIDRFIGLGQLSADQLASLVDTRKIVTAEQFELASRAWRAFRAPDPSSLLALAGQRSSTRALPFLGDALWRFFEEYPSTANGLPRTAQVILDVLDDGDREGGALFRATEAYETSPFMGDWGVFSVARALAAAPEPLVRIDPKDQDVDLRGHQIAITGHGRAVRRGTEDAIRLNGIDVWRGGVHLAGSNRSPWRWDGSRKTLVSLEA